jgi:hypothetical protein
MMNIPIGHKHCANCIHGKWDCSDSDYGGGTDYYACKIDKQPEEVELDLEEDYIKLAESCNYYDPIIAKKCGFCGKEIDKPIFDLLYVYDGIWNTYPCCSNKCKTRMQYREEWGTVGIDCTKDKLYKVYTALMAKLAFNHPESFKEHYD